MTAQPQSLKDAMPGRSILARWVICGTLTLETAMHLGGEGADRVDMPVLRDAREGKPLMPGTTLTGALRNALVDRLAGYAAKEPSEVSCLFGNQRGDDNGSQSPLIVFDAIGSLPPDGGVELRDGVSISPKHGTAEDNKKYDYEVLPAGTTFSVRLDLLISDEKNEKFLIEMLAASLDALSHKQTGFGARRTRGLGKVSTTWAAKRFALDSPQNWLDWALSERENSLGTLPVRPCIRDVFEIAAPEEIQHLSVPEDTRNHVTIDLNLRVDHDLLVRSPGSTPDAPDVSHLRSGGVPILSGTTLTGAMRSHAMRIAQLIRSQEGDASVWIDRLFGSRFEGRRPPPGFRAHASRLWVDESAIKQSRSRRQTRTAIDRFTQAVVTGALFDEQTEMGGHIKIQLNLRNPNPGELGLVLLTIKDLLNGWFSVGGTSSIGRGVLSGTATVTFHGISSQDTETTTLRAYHPPQGKAASKIQVAIKEFREAPAITNNDDDATTNTEERESAT